MFTFPYVINNQVLTVIDCVTDLGVMYDNHLSFIPHINKTVNNPYRNFWRRSRWNARLAFRLGVPQ